MRRAELTITQGLTSFRVVHEENGDAEITISQRGQVTYQQFKIPSVAVGIVAEFLRDKDKFNASSSPQT